MKYLVHLAQTSNFEIEVEAKDIDGARNAAWDIWAKAPEVGGYEVGPTETDIVSMTPLIPNTLKGGDNAGQ